MKILTTTALLLVAGLSHAAEEKQRLEFSGRVFLDADYADEFYDKDGRSSNSELQLNNLRGQIDYDFPAGWEGRLQVDLNDNDKVRLSSAYMRYTKLKFADITLGRMKEPLGFERNTNSANQMAIEDAMVTTAFTPGKNWGVHLFDGNKKRTWAIAAVLEDVALDTSFLASEGERQSKIAQDRYSLSKTVQDIVVFLKKAS